MLKRDQNNEYIKDFELKHNRSDVSSVSKFKNQDDIIDDELPKIKSKKNSYNRIETSEKIRSKSSSTDYKNIPKSAVMDKKSI